MFFSGNKLYKLILLFSKDGLNWSKVIQIFIMSQNIYISDKYMFFWTVYSLKKPYTFLLSCFKQ